MRGMKGMRGVRVGMWGVGVGIRVGMQGLGVGKTEVRVREYFCNCLVKKTDL